MRIAVVNITGGGVSGGYLKYLKNMLPRLSNHKDVKALTCLCPDGIDVSSWFTNLSDATYYTYRHLYLNNFINTPLKIVREHLLRFSPDLLFIPTDRYIHLKNIPVVNMVQNMEPHTRNISGDPLYELIKKKIQQNLTRISVSRADHTIAVSDFVKDYITSQYDICARKVHKIYHGITVQPKAKSERPPSVPLEPGESFIFTCGSIRPARGLEDALEALLELKLRHFHVRLVIAGDTIPGMKKYRSKLEKFILLNGLTRHVFWAGFLNAAQMRWCYKMCSVFIMTSRIEACPNIAIEAMSHGALSITADNPPMPEFFSECAAYYQPGNGQSLAKAISHMLMMDRDKRNSLSESAKKRGMRFSWDATAEKTMNVFMQAIACR